MFSFKELKKAARHSAELTGRENKLAILGNSATQFLTLAVRGYAVLTGLKLTVYEAGYDQIEAQLLDPHSEVYSFGPDEILLYPASERLYEDFLDLPFAERTEFAEKTLAWLRGIWDRIAENGAARILQTNFTEIDDRVLGNYSARVESSFIYQIRKLNYLLEEAMKTRTDVYPIDLLSIQLRLGQAAFHENPLYYSAKMTIAPESLPWVAQAVTDVISAMEGRLKKCVILDLDNTLWGGVVGDAGPGGIEIGELGRGHAFLNFQRWLKQLKECGVLLAVCSKNDESIAREAFEKNREMVLKLSDFAVFAANWEDKAANIRRIQQRLNIGMDSIVFVDDNPFERNLVRSLLPEVAVPEMPEDPADYLDALRAMNYFETASFTGAGSDRTALYRAEFARQESRAAFESLADYLQSLQMRGTVNSFEEAYRARIAQLTQRSNQFNLRTVRYTEDEIKAIASDPDYLPLCFTLQDRYGEHGLVSVLILRKTGPAEAFIENWVMSCRVLKRGMEEFVMNETVRAAAAAGIRLIRAEYLPTAKNGIVRDLYPRLGFETTSENCYALSTATYSEGKTWIQREDKNGKE